MKYAIVIAASLAVISSATVVAFAAENSEATSTSDEVTASTLASDIQTAIDALPADATQSEIESAIANVLINSGAESSLERAALDLVAISNSSNAVVVSAANSVKSNQPSGDEGYSTSNTGSYNTGSATNTNPAGAPGSSSTQSGSGSSGGNSDY